MPGTVGYRSCSVCLCVVLDLLGLVCLEQEEGMETNTTQAISFLTVGQCYILNLYSTQSGVTQGGRRAVM